MRHPPARTVVLVQLGTGRVVGDDADEGQAARQLGGCLDVRCQRRRLCRQCRRIGQRTATGWTDSATLSVKLTGANYTPKLTVNGATATLTVGTSTLRPGAISRPSTVGA